MRGSKPSAIGHEVVSRRRLLLFPFPFSLFRFSFFQMAEPGSFAERVKQQADIVRIVGDYVRLKKSGQNFTGLCPFHSEKTPSFAVHPARQIYHCFGCGVGGDVFKFVMEMEKCSFPDAVRMVAEKSGIPVPAKRARTPEERREQTERQALVEMHKAAAEFFRRQLVATPEGRAAAAYLEDRGLDKETVERFGLGYAPAGGDALLRLFRGKYHERLLAASGLFSRDEGGRFFDRFRRRIIFPIAADSGRVVAFAGRALGDEMPKYLNSPETPIYSKSQVLYHLDRAKESIRRADFVILVEGYMDVIAVARAGQGNVVASCGTSLAEPQVKLLARFTRRVVVNFDPDAAGVAATERSLGLLLERDFDVRVLALPAGEGQAADPDLFIRTRGPEEYKRLLSEAPAYLDYLIGRARRMDLTTAEGKLRAVNFLLPYLGRVPNRLLRSEWASRVAAELRIEEPVLRESLRRAAAERKGEIPARPELLGAAIKPAERRLVQMLVEAEGFRQALAKEISDGELHRGLETEKIFAALLPAAAADAPPDATSIAAALDDRDRRLLFEMLFAPAGEPSWEEAASCLAVLRRRQVEAELATVQRRIAASPPAAELRELLTRKQELRRRLTELDA
jgi:DNA primase